MSLEQQVTALVEASNNLTSAVNGKIQEIDQAVSKGIADVSALVTRGAGTYNINGSSNAGQWKDIADIGDSAIFSLYVISSENNQMQLQEWSFVHIVSSNFNTAIRVDNYGVMHSHSNDLFFSLDTGRKKLMAKKDLTTNRRFSIFLRVGSGNVTAVPNQVFN